MENIPTNTLEQQVEQLDDNPNISIPNNDFSNISDEEFIKLDEKIYGSTQEEINNYAEENPDSIPDSEAKIDDTDPENKKQIENSNPESEKNTSQLDVQNLVELLQQPIKADGKEIKIQSADELIRLVQMGVNYSSKMEKFNADNRLVTALKDNKLFTPQFINQLIDMSRGDKTAIRDFIDSNKINVNDLLDQEDEFGVVKKVDPYIQKDNLPDEKNLVVSNIITKISENGDGEFVDALNNKYLDNTSIEAIYNDPSILTSLYELKKNGTFDIVQTEIDRMKILQDPKIMGKNYIQTFMIACDSLQQAKNNLNKDTKPSGTQEVKKPAPVAEKTVIRDTTVKDIPDKIGIPKSEKSLSKPINSLSDIDLSTLSDKQILELEDEFKKQL